MQPRSSRPILDGLGAYCTTYAVAPCARSQCAEDFRFMPALVARQELGNPQAAIVRDPPLDAYEEHRRSENQ
jgi:hypothetical protein